jgi:aminomethyltransferase
LGFVVKLQKERFIGREVLVKQKDEGAKRRRVGLKMLSSGIPRADYEIHGETGGKIGLLTSGTFSPLLKCGIGMGYVGAAQAQEGKRVGVKIRDKTAVGQITAFPLYDADKYGFKRKTS